MNSINPSSGDFSSIGMSSLGRSMGRDAEPVGESSDLGWREILLLACSYSYLDEEKRNQLLANGLGSHFRASA